MDCHFPSHTLSRSPVFFLNQDPSPQHASRPTINPFSPFTSATHHISGPPSCFRPVPNNNHSSTQTNAKGSILSTELMWPVHICSPVPSFPFRGPLVISKLHSSITRYSNISSYYSTAHNNQHNISQSCGFATNTCSSCCKFSKPTVTKVQR